MQKKKILTLKLKVKVNFATGFLRQIEDVGFISDKLFFPLCTYALSNQCQSVSIGEARSLHCPRRSRLFFAFLSEKRELLTAKLYRVDRVARLRPLRFHSENSPKFSGEFFTPTRSLSLRSRRFLVDEISSRATYRCLN